MFILHAIGAVIGFLFRMLAAFCKILYRILKALHIRLLFLYLVVCGILQLCFRTFDGFASAYFWVGIAACAAVTLYGWTSAARERKRRRELTRRSREERAREKEAVQDNGAQSASVQAKRFPQYFEVEGHEGFMFAEYENRYELFRREADGWTHIRTDYKEDKK